MKLVEVTIAKTVHGTGGDFEEVVGIRHDETQYLHPNTIAAVRSGHQHEPPRGQVFMPTTEIMLIDGLKITVIGGASQVAKEINEALR